MKTTFSRTFFSFAAILLAALLLVGIFFQLLAKEYLVNQTLDRLKSHSSTVSQLASAYYTDSTLTGRDFLVNLSVASQVSEADVVICNAAGRLVLCSDSPLGCEHQGLSIASKEYLHKILKQEYVISQGVLNGLYEDTRYIVSTTIRDSKTGAAVGIVIVSTPMVSTLSVLQRLADTYLSVSVLVVLAAVVVMTIYTRKSSNPLRDMAKTATAFGHGDLKARANVPPGAPEEIQNLAIAFNNMARSLEKSEYQRKEFVANVSHELKTPMTTIGGYVDGILDGTIPAAQQARYLQVVSDETKRLNRLVRSMLDISQLQEQGMIPEEKKTRFDVSECVGKVLITFEGKILAKNLNVQVQFPELPVFAYACEDYITQAVYNLVDNAVKFCQTEGVFGLRVWESDQKVFVSVSNTGPTIPAQELPQLFERFHKLDKSRSEVRDGWGLGLYIVKMLICSHGEDISVSSENGETEFTFTLPVAN